MELPVIDLAPYLQFSAKFRGCGSEELELDPKQKELCSEVSRCLRETGALLVKDPRCSAEDNDRLIDMMEKYFEHPDEFKQQQERPQSYYQIGSKPAGLEIPLSLVDEKMREKMRAMPKESQPTIPTGPDLRWQYMWRIGAQPSDTRFKELNFEAPIPEGFPEWKDTMDSWGYKMVAAIEQLDLAYQRMHSLLF